ncbi:FtsX-like permease family protein [Actinomadura rupiterrae]|uniref:FtsX-like permease family protein n=1 Tax=Actinomadura rupiterrae TaxID=559627 RepID=UPI0020A3FEB5|nr:FtsX-like permease family protein [Actinomadura rupiterrae]MCP2336993.1 putative ABC transport system permease protein [Actinomadura rupiterrae]
MNGPRLRLVRTHWAALLAVTVLTAVTTALAVVFPARAVHGYDDAATGVLGTGSSVNVSGAAGGRNALNLFANPTAMVPRGAAWHGLMPARLGHATQEADPFAFAPKVPVRRPPGQRRAVLDLIANGVLAGPYKVLQGTGYMDPAVPQIAVTQETAELFGLKIGSVVRYKNGDGSLPVTVGLIFKPEDPGSGYWADRGSTTNPHVQVDNDGAEWLVGGALMNYAAYSQYLNQTNGQFTFTWRFPVNSAGIKASGVRDLARDLDRYRSAVSSQQDIFPCQMQTPLDARIKDFIGQYATAQVITGLAFSGLAAVLVGALLLGLALFTERLRSALAVQRARGSSLFQLFRTISWLTAPTLLPAAAAGCGVGLLIHAGPPQVVSIYLAAVVALIGIGFPCVLAARWNRGAVLTTRRPETTTPKTSRRRLVLELLVLGLAVVSLVILRRRGLAAQAELGADPLIWAVPVLLGIAAGLVVLRGFPWPLRLAGRLFRRGRSMVGFVGFARASRQQVVTVLPLVVLLLAASVAGFGATVDAALERGQGTAAWYSVGSDAQLNATQFDYRLPQWLKSVRGVTAAVPLRTIPDAGVGGAVGDGKPEITVIAVDLDALRGVSGGAARFVPAAPADPNGMLVSPEAVQSVGTKPTTLNWFNKSLPVHPAGIVNRFPGQDATTPYVIIPFRMLTDIDSFPTRVFVQGNGIDRTALDKTARRAVPEFATNSIGPSFVRYRGDVEHELKQGPMVQVVHKAFAECALIVTAYALLSVLLVLLVGARERGRAIAHLEVLGLSRRQRRTLALIEIGPVVLCAVLIGWLVGMLLPRLTGPVVNLRPYTLGFAASNHAVEPLHLAALAAVLAVAGLAATAVDRLFDARHRLGEVLRTGEET